VTSTSIQTTTGYILQFTEISSNTSRPEIRILFRWIWPFFDHSQPFRPAGASGYDDLGLIGSIRNASFIIL